MIQGFARGKYSAIDIYRMNEGGCLCRKTDCLPLDTKVLYTYISRVICKSYPLCQNVSLINISIYHLFIYSFVDSFNWSAFIEYL